MLVEDLLIIYKNAKLSSEDVTNEKLISIFNGNNYITIPLDGISATELQILKRLKEAAQTRSSWYHYLLNNGIRPSNHDVRIIQFETTKIEDSNIYLEVLSGLFEDVIDAFYESEVNGFLVITDKTIDINTLEAQLLVLNDDFNSKTRLYIGALLPNDMNFKRCFMEERILFKSSKRDIASYSTEFIPHHFTNVFSESPLAQYILSSIGRIEEGERIITTLWEHQGNLSQTANALYIHRNTLIYRLDKFYELTELNLRDLNDLVFCYWISKIQ